MEKDTPKHKVSKPTAADPEMHYDTACKKAKDLAEVHIQAHTVHQALDLYQEHQELRVQNKTLTLRSFVTYCCRIKKMRTYFEPNERITELRIKRVCEIVDKVIENETNTYAIELFAALRRFTQFTVKFTDGVNTAATLPEDYVSARVSKPMPTELGMRVEDIAELWINANAARKGCGSVLKVVNLIQQIIHVLALMIPSYRLMQCMPQLFYFVVPRAINRQKQ